MGAGGIIALVLAPRKGWASLATRATGGVLLTRALTNLPLRRLLGLAPGRSGLRFEKTITIGAPVQKVFEFCSNPENFSRVLEHVQEVKKLDDNRFRWAVAGPAATSISWETRIVESIPNQLLSFRSQPGSLVRGAGIVRFQPEGDRGTRISLRMSYNPPAAAIGHAVAILFGIDPKRVLDEDLARMKSLFEVGKTTAHSTTVASEQLSA